MTLSPEAIREYQEIYLQEFGAEISFAEAEREAKNLITLFSILSQKK